MKYIWQLTINIGYDWEYVKRKFFTKRKYAEEEGKKHSIKGYQIDKIKVVR